jgi:hypothetical protein
MIKARFIIEIAGSPKDHVEAVMKGVMEKIKKESDVIKYNIYEAKEVEKLWNTFTEVDVSFKNTLDLMAFCFDKMPSSIEMLEPEDKLVMKREDFEDLFNNLMSKLHDSATEMRDLKAANLVISRQLEKNT